jgi:hypothetical protein
MVKLLPTLPNEILVPPIRARSPVAPQMDVTPPPVNPDTLITILPVFPVLDSEILVPATSVTAPEIVFRVVTPPLLLPPVDPDTPMTILFPEVYSEMLVPAVKMTFPDSVLFMVATPAATPPVYGTPLILRDPALMFWFWNVIPPTEWARVESVVVNFPFMTVKFPLLSSFSRCVRVPPVQTYKFVFPPNAPI